jgi:uncharacterized protein (TIGR02246 family)
VTDAAREVEDLERRGWEALSGSDGSRFYAELMADDGLMVFPGVVFDKQATIQAIADAAPWATFEMSEVQVLEASPEAAIVTYRAMAQRHGQAPYRALMSTAYVRRKGSWQLILHQQTPDPEGE